MKSGQVICARCNSSFECGSSTSSGSCWCHAYPSYFKPGIGAACICQSCLKEETLKNIDRLIREYKLSGKTIDMTKYHTDNSIEDIDYYMESGFMVFTAWYLLKRGYCCDNDCRHCPY